MTDVDQLCATVLAVPPALGPVRLVCVDGPAGSGKTTIAAALARTLAAAGADVAVVHVDDLLEGWTGLPRVWARIEQQLLAPLAAGRPASYQRYDWVAERFDEHVDVPVPDVLVLEGCGSAPRAVDGRAVLKVFVEAPVALRLTRGLARDGEAMRDAWLTWLDVEEAEFEREATRARADVVVDGSGAPPRGRVLREEFRAAARDRLAGPVLEAARSLLGAHVTTTLPDGVVTVHLTEVEAYDGENDPGSHAYRGRTPRNDVMFGPAGHLYAYRHMGLHVCANVVTGTPGSASAVLLRAGEVVAGVDVARARRTRRGVARNDADLARGPARLAVALGITLELYGADVLSEDSPVRLELPTHGPGEVAVGPRVGVSGPGGDAAAYPWRLWLSGEATVSAYRPGAPRRRSVGGGRGSGPAGEWADRPAPPRRQTGSGAAGTDPAAAKEHR